MAKQHAPRFLKIVQDAKTRIRETTVEEVKRRLDAGETLTLVDVREESEWAKGHLPGAIHLGKGVIERDAETALPDERAEIILYCGGGFRSALAADNLQKMGYANVLSMDGGFTGWKDAGLPVVGPQAAVESGAVRPAAAGSGGSARASTPTQASPAGGGGAAGSAQPSGDSLKNQGDKLGEVVP